jgi:hypothetical protein
MTKCRILLGVCFVLGVRSTGDAAVPRADLRIARVEAFFRLYGCPEPYRARNYVLAADMYQLDYRLLPALSVRESLCGKGARLNNYWGWDSARIGFVSVETGIDYVAGQLARGKYYRGKSLDQKLHAYNHRLRYAMEVKLLMNRME